MGSDSDRDAILESLQLFLNEQIPHYVAAAQKLTITFNDIDMAGDFEPWRGPDASHVRIIKEIYPPRQRIHLHGHGGHFDHDTDRWQGHLEAIFHQLAVGTLNQLPGHLDFLHIADHGQQDLQVVQPHAGAHHGAGIEPSDP